MSCQAKECKQPDTRVVCVCECGAVAHLDCVLPGSPCPGCARPISTRFDCDQALEDLRNCGQCLYYTTVYCAPWTLCVSLNLLVLTGTLPLVLAAVADLDLDLCDLACLDLLVPLPGRVLTYLGFAFCILATLALLAIYAQVAYDELDSQSTTRQYLRVWWFPPFALAAALLVAHGAGTLCAAAALGVWSSNILTLAIGTDIGAAVILLFLCVRETALAAWRRYGAVRPVDVVPLTATTA